VVKGQKEEIFDIGFSFSIYPTEALTHAQLEEFLALFSIVRLSLGQALAKHWLNFMFLTRNLEGILSFHYS
jgi:hypothetical protein